MGCFRRLRTAAVSAFCAFALWAYLDSRMSSEREFDIGIAVIPPDGMSVRFIQGDAASVVLRGRAERIAPPFFEFDARNLAEGEYEVLLDRRMFRAPGGVTVVSVLPETLRFVLEGDSHRADAE